MNFIKIKALIALCIGCFSLTIYLNDSERYRFGWNASSQRKELRPDNPVMEPSSFAIDGKICSYIEWNEMRIVIKIIILSIKPS